MGDKDRVGSGTGDVCLLGADTFVSVPEAWLAQSLPQKEMPGGSREHLGLGEDAEFLVKMSNRDPHAGE